MRLLNVQNKKLHTFYSEEIPPYAILSHTWLEDGEEVTFTQIQLWDTNLKSAELVWQMPGFRKLDFLCRQAKEDGYEWAWIDTCCIDKSSSVELAEALNPMFRWYRNAEKCYVYLADVVQADVRARWHEVGKSTFDTSRWFTRGWTLQELLAPKVLMFYDKHGHVLGDREVWASRIQRITSIPAEAIDGSKSLWDFSVEQRFSWAEGRNTKREEDAAYCLMGLFDVHIPLIYGEGRQKAMRRLRREIRISSEESEWGTTRLPMPAPAVPLIEHQQAFVPPATAAEPPGGLAQPVFPAFKDDAEDAKEANIEKMQQEDPLGTQIWKLYCKTRTQLPNAERMENMTWRMMAINMRRVARQRADLRPSVTMPQ